LFVGTYVAIWPQPTKAPNSILQLQPLESSQGQLRANKAEPLLISNSASKGSALALVSSIRLSTGGDDVVVSTAAKANRDGVVGEDFTDDAAVKHVAPALGRDMITGELVISTYGTLSFPGDGQSCQEIGGSMLRDLDLPEETLDVLIHADEITVVRICATNGSVVMTCRNDLITINRRGPRPDDKCNQEI
jgi:hypothetical protein